MEPLLVVGAGAVGGTLAARWAAAGREVLVLGRTAASEAALTRDGLTFIGRDGRRRRIRGLLGARRHGRGRRCEAAFFCVKSAQTAAAIRAARPWIGPGTAVVGLQNGLGHERLLRGAFGPERSVAGSAFLGADRPAARTVSNSWGNKIVLAANARNGGAVRRARRALSGAGWEVSVAGSEDRLLWTKLCFNAATNPLGALCAVPNGRLAEDPALRHLMLAALAEAVAIARKAGHPPLYRDMAGLVVRACRQAPIQRNSMLQDLEAGRITEIRAIAGPVLAAGRRLAVASPVLSRLSALVARLERTLARPR